MLREQKGNMYEWVTHTWNPVSGKCPHNCIYCYMKGIVKRPLHLDQKSFKDCLGAGRVIFIGSGTDMFCRQVPLEWIKRVFQHCNLFPKNKYFFQSKNPRRFLESVESFKYPKNIQFCTTIESDLDHGVSDAPTVRERAYYTGLIAEMGIETAVTIEPIMSFTQRGLIDLIKTCSPMLVNIGADSKGHGLSEPDDLQLERLISTLRGLDGVKIHKKRNLVRLLKKR